MSELDEVNFSDEKESISSTTSGEDSTEDDDLQEKLHAISIYKLIFDRLNEFKTHLEQKKFKQIELNWDSHVYGFDVELFTISKESKCNLVQVMKSFIKDKDKYVKTYTKDTFILIAVCCDKSLNGAFAICTGAGGYHQGIPFVDTTFAYSVSSKILDPKTVGQLKCRFLNGQTITIDQLFHKDRKGTYLPNVINNSFFIAERFQAKIKSLLDSDLAVLLGGFSVQVTSFSLKIRKSLSLLNMLSLMKELLKVHRSTAYANEEGFEFLKYVKPVASCDQIKELNNQLKTSFQGEVDRNRFFICHKNYEKWVNCEEVKLSDGKDKLKTWEGRPDISDIFDALGEKHKDWESLKISYKSERKWSSDPFLNYIHGHVLYDSKYYFHIGKDWFEVDVEHIRIMEIAFFKEVKEKLLLEEHEGYLPLPWCMARYSNKQIDADQCIALCKHVLSKSLSEEDIKQIKIVCDTIDCTSEQGQSTHFQDDKRMRESPSVGNNSANANPVNEDDNGNSLQKKKQHSGDPKDDKGTYGVSPVMKKLSDIIGDVECKLCWESQTPCKEENYNRMYYMLLNEFLKKYPDNLLNKRLDVDPDNIFPTFLLGDKILAENVELFDILKITKNKLYLYHVKEGFGQKTRDAVSQIRISASVVSKARIAHTQDTLEKYYKHIIDYKGNDETRKKMKADFSKQKYSKEDFLNLFRKKTIVYVYAFLDDKKGRKPINELVSDEQCLIKKKDFNKALKLEPDEYAKIDTLCSSLTLESILAETNDGFRVERKEVEVHKTKDLFQMFKREGFTDSQSDVLLDTLQSRAWPTILVKSHIAKFELLRLVHDFNTLYPEFELKFCQIQNKLQ